jgi:putative transposase
MSYPPRIFIPGVSLHVFPRGLNGAAITRDEEDAEHLRRAVAKEAAEYDVSVHAFSFMTTHYHLIVTPTTESGLPQTMQIAGGRHTRYFNKKYKRMGTIWNERYNAVLLDDERYWYTCLRYVDLNPFRARMVSAPEESHWSSYSVHAFGEKCDWLTPHPLYLRLGSTPEERQAAYRAMCNRPLTDDDLHQLRYPARQRVVQLKTGS